ncbi:unnamed protein product [Prorocentrum cordatum]|uniref:Helicase C-terminal domain-containing protein n=1 Tax=Prorocentrum cordatum TaxID=2364126 RepID=A0ABN9XPR6_9DINO|nr:unnamed protein product [Polarella glacialis]
MLDDSKDSQENVKQILERIRPDRQVLLFSATWQESLTRWVVEGGLSNRQARCVQNSKPVEIYVGSTTVTACRSVEQRFWYPGVNSFWADGSEADAQARKLEALCEAVKMLKLDDTQDSIHKALIFCNDKEGVERVARELKYRGHRCEAFSSNSSRAELLDLFRCHDNKLPMLVCTQVLGRGMHFDDVKYVVNYDFPNRGMVDYVHRIGRTGRGNKKGFALTLLEELDLRYSKELVDSLREIGYSPSSDPPLPHWLEMESRRYPADLLEKVQRQAEAPAAGCRGRRTRPRARAGTGPR